MEPDVDATAPNRRELLLALSALGFAPSAVAQPRTSLKVRAINHMTLAVTDPKRSLDFYQTLFGLPVQARQGDTVVLRIGPGPQFMALSKVQPGQTPSITHYCVTVEDFDVERIFTVLSEHGVTRTDAAGVGLSGGRLKARVRMRGPEFGGAKDGTPEIYVGDPQGNVVQLQAPNYAGGAGKLGEVTRLERAPKKGLIPLEDYSHFTLFGADATKTNAWYRALFGVGVRSMQGPNGPTLAIGRGSQFVMNFGPQTTGVAPNTALSLGRIDHACLTTRNFNVAALQKTLETLGLQPVDGKAGPVPPLRHYVTMRMENRGGAKEGTPEFYFTDADGILLQLQDATYCGGSGYLGNACRTVG
jgi:catechol 2,3-dioxygenase-like lactoylglutathione lyase family enzyme